VKFNFLQGDFSAGELSPRAQGHAESEAYKAGLKLAANTAPTRTGSIASRAGLEFLLAGIDGNTLAASNLPVQHIPIMDGPFGDMVLEISTTGIRLLDKNGVIIPWNFLPVSELLQFTVQDGSFAYGDPDTRTVYLRSLAASGVRSYYASKATLDAYSGAGGGPNNAFIAGLVFGPAGAKVGPAGTNHNWTFSGKIAGDSVTAHIGQAAAGVANANVQDIAIVPDANGNFSITFRPNVGGADQDFYIQLKTANADTATVLWNLKLTKNNAKEIQDTTASIVPPFFGVGTRVAPAPDRIRAAAFWAFGDYWIAFAGGADNAYAGYALRWHFDPAAMSQWTFGTLPVTANSIGQILNASTVAVFQDRLWYGVNLPLPAGKRVVRASSIGFGAPWGYAAQAGSTGAATNASGKPYLFQFIVETVTAAVVIGQASVPYTFPCLAPDAQLIVKVDNKVRRSAPDYTIAGHTFDYETSRPSALKAAIQSNAFLRDTFEDYLPIHGIPDFLDQDSNPGGSVYFNPAGGAGIIVNGTVKITRVALANDPLDLTLSSPAGKVAWLNVLRGLAMGTTRTEKRFGDGEVLAVDPATGSTFNLRDESSHGADPALNAVNINDRILFVQRGRKILRLAGINIATDGGLISEDIGVAGEHLTVKRVRSVCYLKSPVPRAVMAFDDGTGAVMTLVGKGVAFSRFTIPTCFGGIYSVACLDGDDDSELWVGTENGATLRAKTFESDIITRQIVLPNAVPAAPTHLTYDNDNPLPPVMDGWVRCPLVNNGGAQYAVGLPAVSVGLNVYAYVNGQVRGPYVVGVGGKVTFEAGLDKTWVDATGARRAQEIYIGILYPDHRWTTLPLEGGNPTGASQNLSSRKPQLYLRLVDSYLPLVNGKRFAERGGSDPTDELATRITGDRRATEEGFNRGAVVDVSMDKPLRMEISAIHGGVIMNSV
jgi:hypothetical protein